MSEATGMFLQASEGGQQKIVVPLVKESCKRRQFHNLGTITASPQNRPQPLMVKPTAGSFLLSLQHGPTDD